MFRLSSFQRSSLISEIQSKTFDLLVIGGGITGAGIALDAALRGLSVALIEKNDFAWGTSSRSTKLIHGGLRYLKQFEFRLVHEVGVERRRLFENAPHVVKAERMLLPIVKNGTLGKFTSSLGLFIYDYLAEVESGERRKMLAKNETCKSEPLLKKDRVTGGGLYYEYRTDDSRLVMEVLKSAAAESALCLNYFEATGFTYNAEDKINGVKALDQLDGKAYTVSAGIVVNAAGPWVDKLRNSDKGEDEKGKKLRQTKGVHVVVPYSRLPVKQSLYFDAPDKRMIFAIPRQDITYIGTTDTFYGDDLDFPVTSKEDALYLLNAVNSITDGVNLVQEDIISSWAGLRPLIYEEGKSPSELSRKDEIFISSTGLLSIAGGKLTGYRKMAEKICDLVCSTIENKRHIKLPKCKTINHKLFGTKTFSIKELEEYIISKKSEAVKSGIHPQIIENWVNRYGAETDVVLALFNKINSEKINTQLKPFIAELRYCVNHESVHTLSDFLIRRTGMLYFERNLLAELSRPLNEELSVLLGLSAELKKKSMDEFLRDYDQALQLK